MWTVFTPNLAIFILRAPIYLCLPCLHVHSSYIYPLYPYLPYVEFIYPNLSIYKYLALYLSLSAISFDLFGIMETTT